MLPFAIASEALRLVSFRCLYGSPCHARICERRRTRERERGNSQSFSRMYTTSRMIPDNVLDYQYALKSSDDLRCYRPAILANDWRLSDPNTYDNVRLSLTPSARTRHDSAVFQSAYVREMTHSISYRLYCFGRRVRFCVCVFFFFRCSCCCSRSRFAGSFPPVVVAGTNCAVAPVVFGQPWN